MAVIIYPKTMNWTFMKQRPQQLMTQFGALGHQVYFENLAPLSPHLQEVEPGVHLFTDHQSFMSRTLPRLRKEQPVVVWTTWAKQRSRLTLFKPDAVIYDCCDEFPHWAKYEAKMVEASDHLVATAKSIKTRLELAYPDKPVTLIPNAADQSLFDLPPSARPSDLPEGPIVAYIGAWAYWVDHALFEQIARTYPGVNFVSIGAPYGDIPSYTELPNVHVLGEKPHSVLKQYFPHIDVAIIPFLYHPITLATNPVKAYEYLATGVRVLSTALPECIHMEPHVTTATTHDDFTAKLGHMLATPDSEANRNARTQYARQNRWQERGIAGDEVISEVLRKKSLL
ncbi:glycosyl transferase family 1 [Paenibacillus zeisoli]|uniref:Glycosyl transferase family 1 n=1 Tax=Paenibacillus zeisoli TaxID=2496267 RepID=A0A433X6L0_9BACL|nr:glycosyl transferase family 1 [Paenibacillus zeisoli]RUT29661.1 glycosyl transferase family 1 [Paenibacillus zeisoli]